MGDFEKIAERGYIYQATDLERIKSMLNGEKITFYLGIDPTADSLHIGHFFALTMVRRLQQFWLEVRQRLLVIQLAKVT